MENKPIIDVIIPSYYPDEKLLSILEKLNQQSLTPRAVRLINTEKNGLDQLLQKNGLTQELLKGQFQNFTLDISHISRKEFDHGGTRSRGARASEGADFIMMMTQDAVPDDENLIEALAKPFGEDALLTACYARQLAREDATVAERYSREFNYPDQSRTKSQNDFEELGIKTYFCSNVCAMYRRSILKEMGYFPEGMIFNEDMVFAGRALKAGYHSRYEANARVIHSHNLSASAQFHRNFDLGVSQADHPEIFAQAKSESEGVRYVKTVIRYLGQHQARREIPGFVVSCGARLIGYKLGKNYKKLPKSFCKKASSNRAYWERTDA